jgi:thiamine biosynthesis lipoprotein
VAPRLVAAGLLPRPAGAPEPDPEATFDDVVVAHDGTIVFRRPLWLDLGGVAKGFAVDRAVARLRAAGIRRGCVDAGGDLRVFGGRPLRVALRDAGDGRKVVAVVELVDAALASTSAAASRNDDGSVSHLVDPQRARFLAEPIGATVVARSAAVADAWTKGVLFAPELARRELPRWGAAALLVGVSSARWLSPTSWEAAA